MEFKKCNKCGEIKGLDEFYNRKSAKDKHDDICKKCAIEKTKEWYKLNTERGKKRSRKWYKENLDKAKKQRKKYREENSEKIKEGKKKWNKEYYKDEKNAERKKEYGRRYRKENPEKNKEYREKNSEKIKKRSKKYRKENSEKIKEASKKYKEKNSEKNNKKRRIFRKENLELVREKDRRYIFERKKVDIKFKLKKNVSSHICGKLKMRLSSKSGKSTWDFLPYSVDELKKHLENLFEPWMNWSNWGLGEGKWNIDHKIPHSFFDYKNVEDEEFQECWALENLQPLDAIENIKKGNKLIY